MDPVVNAIVSHQWDTDDAEKLRTALKREGEAIRANLGRLPQLLGGALVPPQHSFGIALLLHFQATQGEPPRQLSPALLPAAEQLLLHGDYAQLRLAEASFTGLVRAFVAAATQAGSLQRSLPALRHAVENFRPAPHVLTNIHVDFVRACVQCRAHHYAAPLVAQEIADVSMCGPKAQSEEDVLVYFYNAALVGIALGEYEAVLRRLLVILTAPSSALSAVQVEAYKKFALVSLLYSGDVVPLPKYVPPVVQRYASSGGYIPTLVEAFKKEDEAGLRARITEHREQLLLDKNVGLANRCAAALERQKVRKLTQTYLTLAVGDIAAKAGIEPAVAERQLVGMILRSDVVARIDEPAQMVSFRDDTLGTDTAEMADQLHGRLRQLLQTAERISAMEREAQCALARSGGQGSGAGPAGDERGYGAAADLDLLEDVGQRESLTPK